MFSAETIIQALADSRLKDARRQLDPRRVMQDAIAIQQIPAPTFDEQARAQFVRERFLAAGLHDVALDEVFNVFGRWPGADSSQPALLVSAHTDTVFPADTDLTVRRHEDHVYGPGLGDNSLGVAALFALIEAFHAQEVRPPVDVWFVANSREEGLGDLGGIRAVWDRLGTHLGAAVVLEGMALGRIYHAGIAVRRLHITCTAPGGHSWLHFGQPSAIHGLVQLGARITALTPPTHPRTTYNIGLISGGRSVNSLATEADLYLDLRSQSPDALATLEAEVLAAMAALQRPDLSFSSEVVGDRPAGHVDARHPLVGLAAAALKAIGHDVTYESGSTDANVLLANGLPTVTVGVTYGGNAHRLDEYIQPDPIANGIWHLLLLVVAAAEHVASW